LLNFKLISITPSTSNFGVIGKFGNDFGISSPRRDVFISNSTISSSVATSFVMSLKIQHWFIVCPKKNSAEIGY